MKYSIFFSALILSFFANSCKNELPTTTKEEPSQKWEAVPILEGMDIRYTIQHNGALYVGAVDERTKNGAVYKTQDAKNWTKVKQLGFGFGAIATHGDTLYVMGDSLYRYHPSFGWQSLFACFFGRIVSDMTFYKGKLYAMLDRGNPRTLRVEMNGEWTALRPLNGYETSLARFCKINQGDSEVVYVRPLPTAQTGIIFRFDGERFIQEPTIGLTGQEYPTTNAMIARGDSLLLGYYVWYGPGVPTGGIIKSYKNGEFSNLPTDSLPLLSLNSQLENPFSTYPNSLGFQDNRLFVATSPIGVVEWIPKTRSWKNLSKGLPTISSDTTYKDFFASITFLEVFKGYIVVGYGHPPFVFHLTTRGMYTYRISELN
ncbi:MAG: hypothetical protein SNJ66_07405 [Chloroherpetonaceae bacterium]